MTALPPPQPPLWAPRLRKHLRRFLYAMDRRTARRLAAAHLRVEDRRWFIAYRDWWYQYGWLTNADPPNQAYAKMIRERRP